MLLHLLAETLENSNPKMPDAVKDDHLPSELTAAVLPKTEEHSDQSSTEVGGPTQFPGAVAVPGIRLSPSQVQQTFTHRNVSYEEDTVLVSRSRIGRRATTRTWSIGSRNSIRGAPIQTPYSKALCSWLFFCPVDCCRCCDCTSSACWCQTEHTAHTRFKHKHNSWWRRTAHFESQSDANS